MRQLTKSQKKLLDKTIASNKDIFSINDLPSGIFEELEKINDTEILYQEANRYIRNAQMKRN